MTKAFDPLQAAFDAINQAVPSGSDPKQLLIASKCRALMAGYHAQWINAGYEVESVEQVVTSDLYNPETQRRSRSFSIAGKIDVTTRRDNRRIIFDHKTTSEDISDPNSPYWRQLAIEGQATHYMLLEWLNERKADGALWDVVRKPQISPKKLSKSEAQAAAVTKRYCGGKLTDHSVLELNRTGRETYEMYEYRLLDDCGSVRPQWYFQRRPVPRLDSQIYEHATDLWEHSQEKLVARRMNRHAKNSGACMLYHSPCIFLGICSGHDTPDSDRWTRKEQVHAELPELPGDGRDVLTISRIRMFQTCRQKEYLAYELGLERPDEEEKEALFFGTIWHLAQEAWWSTLKNLQKGQNEHGHTSNGSTGTELATAASTNV